MNLSVTSIRRVSEKSHLIAVQAGEQLLSGEVVESSDPPLRGMNCTTDLIHDIFGFCGVYTHFARDFFQYLDGKCRPLPWCYGECDDESIQHALTYHAKKSGMSDAAEVTK